MTQVTLFISAVSNEFSEDSKLFPDRVRGAGDYRTYLRDKLTGPDVSVKVQEDFIAGGVLTLDKLVLYLKECDAVIHLVGDMTGAVASEIAVQSLFDGEPHLPRNIAFLAAPADAATLGVSYTQWEAYLAHHYGKRLFICSALPEAPRAARHALVDEQRASQQAHLARLQQLERYAEIAFGSREDLVVEVLRTLRTVLPAIKREALPASPLRLPYASLGELFVGRDEFLAEIRASVTKARQAGRWPRQAVHGLGGMGKTRVAVEYAWRFRDDYTAVLMVNGESNEGLDRELASLTGVLRLDVDAAASEPQRTQLALEWLSAHPGWLLVIDNVDSDEARRAVTSRLTGWTNGHVLITGRVTRWPREVEPLDLRILSADDAARFLLDATRDGRSLRDDDAAQAARLANDELGALCLALEQAAAYINKLELSFAEYRDRWMANTKNVRARADKELMRYHEEKDVSLSVATTWLTTVESLGATARALLEMLSWMAPEGVPSALLDADTFAQRLSVLTGGDDDVEEAVAELRSYSMLSRRESTPFESAGQVHRLVQLITRDSLAEEDRQATLASMLLALEDYCLPVAGEIRLQKLRELAPHLQAVIAHGESVGDSQPVASLLRTLAEHLSNSGLYQPALYAAQRALAIDERIYGNDNFLVAYDLKNVADLLDSLDRRIEAEDAFRRALAIFERECGEDDIRTAQTLKALGQVVVRGGESRHAEAEVLLARALGIAERVLGSQNALLADFTTSLAYLYRRTNRLAEAGALARRAVAIAEGAFGGSAIEVFHPLVNLAEILSEMGEHVEAEHILRRVLLILEPALGVEHPIYAHATQDLARLLVRAGRLSEAEPLLRHALEINERVFGSEHSALAVVITELSFIERLNGRHEAAAQLARRALGIALRTCGEEHSETDVARTNLAAALLTIGERVEAKMLFAESLAQCERQFGDGYGGTLRALIGLLTLAQLSDEYEELERLLARALASSDEIYGECGAPATVGLFTQLSRSMRAEAHRAVRLEPMYRALLLRTENELGTAHPFVIHIQRELAGVLESLSRDVEAAEISRQASARWNSLADDVRQRYEMVTAA